MCPPLADPNEQYDKDPDLRREDVKTILLWTESQSHLPILTELQAILFLHSCYHQLSAAKVTIDDYFTTKTIYTDIFQSGNKEIIEKTLSSIFIKIMPMQTPEGYIVYVSKLIDEQPASYNCVNHMKLSVMCLALYYHKYGIANGLMVVIDMKNTSWGHLLRLSVRAVKAMLNYVQRGAPVRIKGIHFINVNFITHRLVNVIRPFTNSALMNLIKFHEEGSDDVYNFIPRQCLPKDIGGDAPSIESINGENINYMLNNMDFFEWHDAQTVNESKKL